MPLSVVYFLLSFLLLPVVKAGSHSANSEILISSSSNSAKMSAEAFSNLLYDSLQLDDLGMSREALKLAYKGQQNLVKKGIISNDDVDDDNLTWSRLELTQNKHEVSA